MTVYYAVVVCAIIVSTIIILLIQYKLKKLKPRVCLAIAAASLISASAMPAVYYVITLSCKSTKASLPLIATIGAIGASLLLGLIFSIIISGRIALNRKETTQADNNLVGTAAEVAVTVTTSEKAQENYLEQIYDNMSNENSSEIEDYAENSVNEADNSEISVDRSENTDKISIDNYMQDSENLTMEDCIDKACDFRDKGEPEAAAQYFMYALDRKPDKDLTFRIVLDICVLYKSLGQRSLAGEILNSYYDSFRDIMDVSVKEEILFNINEVN